MSRTIQQQLVHFLSDMYSVEQQALAQLVTAPDMAGDPALAEVYRKHLVETEHQAAVVEERLKIHGGSPSAIKDAIMKLGGKGFLLFAKILPETPGRLAAHAYAYEAMEWAGYDILSRFAEQAGDEATRKAAIRIRDEEGAMMARIAAGFGAAEAVSHRQTPSSELGQHVQTHLNEAHALEVQGSQILKIGGDIASDTDLITVCRANLDESQKHAGLIERRLEELYSSTSVMKDAALGAMGLNWAFFFQTQSDTPAKLAAFAYAFEHLKIAGYELLKHTASRANDRATEKLCAEIIAAERSMAERLAATFDSVVPTTLAAVKN